MPKETTAQSRNLADDGSVLSVDTVAVVWGAGESVQIRLGQAGVESRVHEGRVQYSPSLTRHQINDTIRALRKARDSVFGKDA